MHCNLINIRNNLMNTQQLTEDKSKPKCGRSYAYRQLVNYPTPGNVVFIRKLKNTIFKWPDPGIKLGVSLMM